ncbi:MAG: DUF3883 domain-containing protein, partial [Candidatus Methanospirare jalkutatii]|nr:DUF3883 domain-containing protein [Candidatus Methanospirare jalkutatii]
PVVEQIYERLKEEACILTKTNRWKKPSEVLIGDDEIKEIEIKEIVTNEDLQKFFGKEYLSDKIKAKKQVLQKLGVNDFSIDDLIKCLENKEWIKNQNEEWFARLFNYLSKKKLSYEQLERLRSLEIIKLENGELTSINEDTIFFPLEKKEVYGFESELRVIKKEIIDIILKYEKEEKDSILEFLKKLGLKQADPYEIIENHILPVYEKGEWKQKDSKVLMGYVKYIKNKLDRYEKESDKRLNANKPSWKQKEDPLKRLKKSLLIRINKEDEGKECYDKPENIYLPRTYGNENDLEKLFDGIDVNFVHSCYIEQDTKHINDKIAELENELRRRSRRWKKKCKKEVKKIEEQIAKLREEKSKKVAEWKKFFLRIGVSEIPKVYVKKEIREYITNWRYEREVKIFYSKDIIRILDKEEWERNKRFLRILDRYWGYYSKFRKWTDYYFRYTWKRETKKADWFNYLTNKPWLPTTKNTLAKPSEIFLDKPEIREVLGDTVPYLAVKIENEDFIRTLGINTQASVEGVLNYLKVLVKQESKDKEKFEKLYGFLDEHFWEDATKIKEAFKQNSLIFIPDTDKNKNYYSSKEVIWKDVSNIFGKNRIYLEKYYSKEFRTFFVEKLGISEKPTPKDYADVLCSISEKNHISDEDKRIIIRIYEELNRNLNPDKVENPISNEDWWNDFIKKPIFLTNKDEFWSNNGDNIFINDNNELYELFKDEEDIGFLWLPDGYHPDKIKFFIKACGIRYLSENVEIEPLLEGATHLKKDEELTQRIQTITPYVLRYLYWREYAEYEKLKKNGTLEKILAIEVYVTDNLRVRYSIKINKWREISKGAERTCIYHKDKNCIYMKNMKRDGNIYDLAVEFSKVFGEIKGLDDFVMNIMSNIPNAENIMRVKNIEPLTEPKEEILKRFSKIKEIETVEEAEKEKQLSESESKEIYPVKDKTETEKITQIPAETSAQDLSGLVRKTVIPTDEDILDETKEKEWAPKFSPKDVPINVEEYTPKEVKEETTEKKVKLSDEKSATKPREDWARSTEGLSKKAKEAIGRWGEEYAVYAIIKEKLEEYFNIKIGNNTFKDMLKHYDNIIKETNEGYKLEKDGRVIVEVVWLNKNGESKQHYDIKIKNEDEIFIEVKSTKEEEKTLFQVSKDQWRLMKEKGDKFYIYRVYGVGTKNAKIEKIHNPVKQWKDEKIEAYPICIVL